MPAARRLAPLVALVVPLVTSAGCVCTDGSLFQCYHVAATAGASDSATTGTVGSTDTTNPTDPTDPTASSMSMSQSETMEPTCNMNGRCDEGESIVLCPDECKCGNGEIDDDEACDEGADNSKDDAYHVGSPETAPCNSACTAKVPFCGDGTCQKANEDMISCAKDGCVPVCGNKVVEAGEDCDDGNLDYTDACPACKAPKCGDGYVEAGVEACDDNNMSDNDACTNACKMATCGDGLTWTGTEDCDDANAVDTDKCDVACKTVVHRKVFVSSVSYSGNLGGLAGADAKCQTLATAAGLTLKFKAWLSDATLGPTNRFDTAFTGVYELVDGTLVAHGWTDLTDGLTHAIDLNETNNAMPVDTTVWSNTTMDGKPLLAANCMLWSSASAQTMGAYGLSAAKDGSWTASETAPCSIGPSLYCFEDP